MKFNGFPRYIRVKKRRDFLRIQGQGQKFRTRHFLIFVAPVRIEPSTRFTTILGSSRIGITVTRKIGTSVVRNRIKRLVREAFRQQVRGFPNGWEMVWIAKNNAPTARYIDVVRDMKFVSRQLRTWK